MAAAKHKIPELTAGGRSEAEIAAPKSRSRSDEIRGMTVHELFYRTKV